ncbi:MAG: spore germination protein, partial [Oscillospiraceae bacterium]
DFAGALRIWRFLLAVAASIIGCFGMVLVGAVLVCRLASIESFGVAYLTPFASNAGEQVEGHAVLRQPLPRVKLREKYLNTRNRRNQG